MNMLEFVSANSNAKEINMKMLGFCDPVDIELPELRGEPEVTHFNAIHALPAGPFTPPRNQAFNPYPPTPPPRLDPRNDGLGAHPIGQIRNQNIGNNGIRRTLHPHQQIEIDFRGNQAADQRRQPPARQRTDERQRPDERLRQNVNRGPDFGNMR